jgi:hypothetical protein
VSRLVIGPRERGGRRRSATADRIEVTAQGTSTDCDAQPILRIIYAFVVVLKPAVVLQKKRQHTHVPLLCSGPVGPAIPWCAH